MISERLAQKFIRDFLIEGRKLAEIKQVPILKEFDEGTFEKIYRNACEEANLTPEELEIKQEEERKRKRMNYGKDIHFRLKEEEIKRIDLQKNRSKFIREAILEKLSKEEVIKEAVESR